MVRIEPVYGGAMHGSSRDAASVGELTGSTGRVSDQAEARLRRRCDDDRGREPMVMKRLE
jgi:hypothetical protein